MTKTDKEERYPIGTEVYYSLEDYETGEDIIYKGTITKIYYTDLDVADTTLHLKMYEVNEGLGMQCNAFYTIEELFALKNRLEQTYLELSKDKLIAEGTTAHVREDKVPTNMDN